MVVTNNPNDPNNIMNQFGAGGSAADVANFAPSATSAAANAQTPPSATPTNFYQNAGMAPLTGWAAQQNYIPSMLSQLFENPWYALGDVFPGLNQTSPLYQQLRDLGADPLALFQLTQGSQGILDENNQGQFANWLANLYQQLGTPGGRAINTGQLLRNLFGANADNTSLGMVLGAGDMGTQVRTLFNLARDATNAGMDPLSARGYQAALARAGDRYGNEMMKAGGEEGASISFQEWAAKNAPWLTGR